MSHWGHAGLLGGAAIAVVLSTGLVTARGGTGPSCATATYTASGLPLSIPDPGSVDASLAVPDGGEVEQVTVGLSITHPFDSDLRLQLVSPAGTAVELARAVGMWGHDFTNTVFDDQASTSIAANLPPFTGSFKPVEPLSAFQGTPQGGTWKLRVRDEIGSYSGELTAWNLDITSCASVSPFSPAPAGAPTPPPLPTGVPSGALPVQGMLITVTDSTDVSDGDVSSVANLEANPGPNGTISLREAILATNNDPGTYTIQFAPSLAGSTIDVGAANGQSLPELTGGHVLIDGDVNGDGRPDITLDGHAISEPSAPYGFMLLSNGNRLHALRLEHFSPAVLLSDVSPNSTDPTPPTQKTFAGNVISGLEITDVAGWQGGSPSGILLDTNERDYQCSSTACSTQNTWSDTRVVGNSIDSNFRGIAADLQNVAGDSIQRIRIAGNHVQVGTAGTASNVPATVGIQLKVGLGDGANQNELSDVVAAYNEVEVAGAGGGFEGASGQLGGSSNLVQNLDLIGNHVLFSGQPAARTAPDPRVRAIEFALSDGCSGGAGVGCSQNNTLEDVQIVGNLLQGQSNAGVMLADSCCGDPPSTHLTNVRVADNLIEGTIPPDELDPWGVLVPGNYDTSNVTVDSNTVDQQITDPTQPHAADLAGGGIVIAGGIGSLGPGGSATGVAITNNRIATPTAGITLVGGGPSDDPAAQNSSGHTISGIVLRGNVITEQPTLALSWDPNAKGIEVIGGLGGTPPATGHWTTTTDNSVTSITLDSNLVNGVQDDVTVHSNFGTGASGNTAALGLQPPTLVVSRTGTGRGTVTSNPAGIDCGSTCSAEFDDRSQVMLTATPTSGSKFAGWSGACTGMSICTVTMSAAESVTATFTLEPVCVVPNVKGKTLEAARKAIKRARCSVGKVKQAASRKAKKNHVISQKPKSHTRLKRGAKINLVVSKGPPR